MKLNKFFKVFAFMVFFLGCVALITCYIVIPNETKLAMDIVVDYLNKPLPIIGLSILTLGGIAITIVSRTSFGKKVLINFRKELDSYKDTYQKCENKALEYKDLAQKKYEETKAILVAYSTEIDNLSDTLIKVCETSPNAKIKVIAQELKDKVDNTKVELGTKLNEIEQDLPKYLEKQVDLQDMKDKINELETMLKGVLDYGKETKDIETNQE